MQLSSEMTSFPNVNKDPLAKEAKAQVVAFLLEHPCPVPETKIQIPVQDSRDGRCNTCSHISHPLSLINTKDTPGGVGTLCSGTEIDIYPVEIKYLLGKKASLLKVTILMGFQQDFNLT